MYLLTWGVYISVSYFFAFSYCSLGSQGKDTEVVCHSLLLWTTFCQNSPPWPTHLGWPYTAWLIFLWFIVSSPPWPLPICLDSKTQHSAFLFLLFFTVLDFTFTTQHIHIWTSFLLWPSCFILSGAISNCPLLFPSRMLDTFWSGGHMFLPFHAVHGFSQQNYWRGISFSPPVDNILSELFTMTSMSWVALWGMAQALSSYANPLCKDMNWYFISSVIWELII